MAEDRKDTQRQQGSTGQRSQDQGGGHPQHDLPGQHGGQQGGKDPGQPRQEGGGNRQLGGDEAGGSGNRHAEQPRERQLGGTDRDARDGGVSRNSQGNLGTTQREWTGTVDTADPDERTP